ncbi:MAG TPA: hypothetical protein VMH81_13580 [Bryobacteraceae bacterium]|nr:hypothetical protein [Bryobacteraceae bacterium]
MRDRLALELELAEELRPVAAPDELWERVRMAASAAEFGVSPRPAPRRRRLAAWAWASLPVAAILTLMIAAATLWLVARGQERGLDLQELAIQELHNGAPLDFQSNDAARINHWIGREAGLEPCIPVQTGVRLAGARVIRKGDVRIAVVSYRVGEDMATLVVAGNGTSANSGHGHSQWQARGQSYALASTNAEDAQAACRLCHATL